jgi:RNase P/RNase MRP subunit POP5
MLKRRDKRRYLVLLHNGQYDGIDIVNLIKNRNSELFGHITTEKSPIWLVQSKEMNIIIICCKLEGLDNILSTIALTDPPIVTLDISGTLNRLRRRLIKTICKD